jgi:hypothetical protein
MSTLPCCCRSRPHLLADIDFQLAINWTLFPTLVAPTLTTYLLLLKKKFDCYRNFQSFVIWLNEVQDQYTIIICKAKAFWGGLKPQLMNGVNTLGTSTCQQWGSWARWIVGEVKQMFKSQRINPRFQILNRIWIALNTTDVFQSLSYPL